MTLPLDKSSRTLYICSVMSNHHHEPAASPAAYRLRNAEGEVVATVRPESLDFSVETMERLYGPLTVEPLDKAPVGWGS